MLVQNENKIHKDIDEAYRKFFRTFEEAEDTIKETIEMGQEWQKKVCDILDVNTKERNLDALYIPYQLLDSNPNNPNSVEAIYSDAELWIKDSLTKRNYNALDGLSKEYEKILVWTEPDF